MTEQRLDQLQNVLTATLNFVCRGASFAAILRSLQSTAYYCPADGLDNAASFRELFVTDYSVLCLDLAGHGQSDHRPTGVRYHLVDNVDDIMGVVDLVG